MVFKVTSVGCSAALGACLAGQAPSVVNMKLVNDRTNIFAGHFNYTVDQVASIPINTAIRGEMALYPSEPYNISQYPGRFGLKASANPKYPDGIVEKNTLRYMLGFDRSTLIPFLQDDPWRPFRMSFQIFQRIIFDHEDGIHPFSQRAKNTNGHDQFHLQSQHRIFGRYYLARRLRELRPFRLLERQSGGNLCAALE